MICVDTSALVKRYIAEPQSAPFDAFFIAHAPVAISRLTLVEMRCGLARRRAGHIDRRLEKRALEEMRTDIQEAPSSFIPWRRSGGGCLPSARARRKRGCCGAWTRCTFRWPRPWAPPASRLPTEIRPRRRAPSAFG